MTKKDLIADNTPGLVTTAELARIFKVKPRTIRTWIEEGCPIAVRGGGRGNPHKFELTVVQAWREGVQVGGPLDYNAERAKLTKAQRQEAEIRIKKQMGNLVAIGEVGKLWADQIGAAKSKLLGMSVRLAPLVMQATSLEECKSIIDELVREALEEIAGNGIPETDIPDGLETPRTANG